MLHFKVSAKASLHHKSVINSKKPIEKYMVHKWHIASQNSHHKPRDQHECTEAARGTTSSSVEETPLRGWRI